MSSRDIVFAAAGAGGDVNYIDDVFSTFLYTGSGTTNAVPNGIALANASNSQFTLAGYTVTNLGGAFSSSFPMRNLTDGVTEIANAQNLAYVPAGGGYFDVYVDLVNPAVVTAYNIAPQGTINSGVNNTPTAFIVKASNNASSWTTLATFTGISTGYPAWNAGTFRTFSFSNTTAYRYYRIENTTFGSNNAGASMSEWNLTGTTTAEVKGGMVWLKSRSDAFWNFLFDTNRGAGSALFSNDTGAAGSTPEALTTFNANGFSLGTQGNTNQNASTFCSWTFAEQEKFFDVITYTGNGTAGRTVAHNLGSVPGMMIIKATNQAYDWQVYHRSLGNTAYAVLNSTAAASTGNIFRWNNTTPTSTVFTLGDGTFVNEAGTNYVAYLFAHDAGGFGTAGTDNVISCGSFTSNGGNLNINLGYEPQYVLVKTTNISDPWRVYDVMRGMPNSSTAGAQELRPNSSAAEATTIRIFPNATGFTVTDGFGSGYDFIYMAIRRPMKPPTSGTQVFSPNAFNEALGTKIFTGFPVDLQWIYGRPGGTPNSMDRLRGVSTASSPARGVQLQQSNANAETAVAGNGSLFWDSTGFQVSNDWRDYSDIAWNFKRAPGFFDEVCYTGTGSVRTLNHNLGVVPELMIVKNRNEGFSWVVYAAPLGATKIMVLDLTDAEATNSTAWNDTAPTSSVFTVGTSNPVNKSGNTQVAYLFATLAGVSKVGSYTGTGATQTINAGLPTGARFVLIKRTDSTGNWWAWDTARGMVTSTDPRIALNSTAAELNNDWVFTTATGFQIVTTDATINASGGSYIYLAIA